MRHAIALPLIAFALIGCRPLDPGAPMDGGGEEAPSSAPPRGLRVGELRIIDGDTFVAEGETIRIADIDAPEMPPRSKCLAEANLAVAAKAELDGLLGASWAGAGGRAILPTLERSGQDRYGRTLALVTAADGTEIGAEMVRRGFAARWSGQRAAWCTTAEDWSSLGEAVTK